jgi:predicted Zn-dependent protease
MELGKNSGYTGDFTFFVLRSSVINAFAVPGG